MDGVFALTERERGCPHGVSAAAAGNDIRQVRLVVLDLDRRCPGRVQIFAVNNCRAGPLLAGAADADRIADGLAVAEHVIERSLARSHHHGAGRIATGKADDVAGLRAPRHCSCRRKKQKRSRRSCQPS